MNICGENKCWFTCGEVTDLQMNTKAFFCREHEITILHQTRVCRVFTRFHFLVTVLLQMIVHCWLVWKCRTTTCQFITIFIFVKQEFVRYCKFLELLIIVSKLWNFYLKLAHSDSLKVVAIRPREVKLVQSCYCSHGLPRIGINQLTSQPPWAYCANPGGIGVRIKKEGEERRLSCVPVWSRPLGWGGHQPDGIPSSNQIWMTGTHGVVLKSRFRGWYSFMGFLSSHW